jgi:hypothetical protein
VRFVAIFVGAIAGCAGPQPAIEPIACEPIFVDKPIAVKATPPASLTAAAAPPLPEFVAPDASTASACLTPPGEQRLLDYVDYCATQLDGWRAWGQE